jgi:ribonuclease G
MSKEMIVSVNGREKKIAILDNGKVAEFYIERGEENTGVAGNVYKGRVMRVLPGMQSAFVDIGLERDAFLYVTDFFDEEEEIERIVMEKGKKQSPEEAKREADEQIERSRVEREKQMESAQEVAEPLREAVEIDESVAEETGAEEPAAEHPTEKPKRGRGRKAKEERAPEPQHEFENILELDFDSSGFERISDDDETAGDLFKDAYVQETIVDKVRAVEFDMESTSAAEVGSLLGEVTDDAGGFERIADEDEEAQPAKGRKRAAKSEDKKETPAKKPKPPSKRAAASHGKFSKAKNKKTGKNGDLEDAAASHKESDDIAMMAVRRGGRGRKRTNKADGDEVATDTKENDVVEHHEASDATTNKPVEKQSRGARSERPGRGRSRSQAPAVDVHEEPQESNNEESKSDDGLRSDDGSRGRNNEGSKSDESPRADDRGRGRERNGEERKGDGGQRSDDRGRGREHSNEEPKRDDGPRVDDRGRERNDRNDRGDRGRRGGRGRGDRPQNGGRGRFDRNDRERRPQPVISDLLKEGQEILVQIAKEPIAKKGARITSHIALPGRYLVYMPTIEHLGVSRKIESSGERSRLRTLIQKIRQDPEITSGGFIVRTAGIGVPEEDLRNDAKYLARMWADAKKGSEKKKSPYLVHQDLDLVQRLLRDQLADDFTAIRIDSEEEYQRTVEFINMIQPRQVNRIKLYTRDEPILDYYGVQEEIDKALKPRVWLKSGGYLVINQTEALVAIDVNTGKFVGKGNQRLEDTITRTNMEAVDEIARQIRLRDLGGILVLDLIDMEDRRNRHKVSQALQEALSHDKSPTKVLSFNDFGLIIMTRKRVKQSLERTMCAPCDFCEGAGWVKSPVTVCYEILAEARRLRKDFDDVRHTTLRVHPDVSKALRGPEHEVLEEIEAYLGSVDVAADRTVHPGQFDFAAI